VFSLTLPVDSPTFWDWIACNLITPFLLFFHAINLTSTTGFFPRFLESRKYKIQIVARVGRKSAVVLSGLTEASYSRFFIGRGFESQRALLENVELGKFILIRLQSPREWKNRNSPRRVLLLLLSNSSGGRFPKKKHACEQVVRCEQNSTMTRLTSLPRKSERSVIRLYS
jgi:hypothetical protein